MEARPTSPQRSRRSLREAAAAAEVEPAQLVGIGVGSPGTVSESGVVSSARNLPGWEDSFPLGETLSKALGTEVRAGNDVQVAVEGEFALGAGREFRSLLGVWWGTGVGGGIVLDGKPWLGRGGAGEIGHMVVERGGAQMSVRSARLHGGLRRAGRDGNRGAPPRTRTAPRPTSSS